MSLLGYTEDDIWYMQRALEVVLNQPRGEDTRKGLEMISSFLTKLVKEGRV